MSSVDKILHVGLCAGREKLSSVSEAFIRHTNVKYAEISTGHPNLNAEVQRIVRDMKPDLTFFQIQAEGILSRETLQIAKENSGRSYNWTGDVRYPTPQWYLDCGDLFHCTFFTNMVDVKTLRAAGILSDYLEIGFDPEIYYPGNGERPIDIVFMANNYGHFPLSGYRVDVAKALKSAFGSRFKLYGSGWPKADGNVNHSQYDEADVYRKAKIAINCSHFNYKMYASDRMLRLMGSGCMCLSHKYDGIFEEYSNGDNVSVFTSIEHLIKKANFCLDNPSHLTRVAARGCKLVHDKFTFDNMVDNLINWE